MLTPQLCEVFPKRGRFAGVLAEPVHIILELAGYRERRNAIVWSEGL